MYVGAHVRKVLISFVKSSIHLQSIYQYCQDTNIIGKYEVEEYFLS